MRKIALILFIILLSIPILATEEIRGIWINSDDMPKTKAEAIKLVNDYHKSGFNLLFPEVMCRGYAIYDSKILERDPRFKDCEDILPVIISEAHKLKMEVHPWVWCFRAGYSGHPGAIITEHPEWLEKSMYGEIVSINNGMWLSPISDEATSYLLSLFKEITTNYNIDGFHLDYVRYESQTPILYGYSTKARKKFKILNGIDPLAIEFLSPNFLKWIKFREDHVSKFVRNVHKELKAIKPNLIISAAVANNPYEARYNFMQNWPHWANNGWIDMIIPMTYVNNDTKFVGLMNQQLNFLDNKVFTSIGIGSHNFVNNEQRNIVQINLARKTNYMGQCLFAAKYMTPSLGKMLKSTVWSQNATLPFKSNSPKTQAIYKYKSNIKWKPAIDLASYIPIEIQEIPKYVANKKTTDINIDGYLDKDEWAPYSRLYIKYNNMGVQVPYLTIVKMTYDDEALYLGYYCEEPYMNKIKATAKLRDGNTFYDDSVEVFINMNPKTYKYNHFSVNTLNTRFDQQMYNTSWTKNWESAIYKGDKMWSCEMKIPFSELYVYSPNYGDKYRMNFTRNRWVKPEGENLAWSVTYGSFHILERFGYVFFE